MKALFLSVLLLSSQHALAASPDQSPEENFNPAFPTMPGIVIPDLPTFACQEADTPFDCYVVKLEGRKVKIADGVYLSFSALEDSRCPADVNCIWEGLAKATFDVKLADGRKEELLLSNSPRSGLPDRWIDELTGLTVRLIELTPRGGLDNPFMEGDYAKIEVSYTDY